MVSIMPNPAMRVLKRACVSPRAGAFPGQAASRARLVQLHRARFSHHPP
jgi:hypothetical protein